MIKSGVAPDGMRIDGHYRRKTARGLTSAKAPPVSPRAVFRLFKVKSVAFDIVEPLVRRIDWTSVRIKPFEGFIFLCGGNTESPVGYASARHYATSRMNDRKKIAGHKVILAERLVSLLHGDDFDDLLQFEVYIAALCAVILIFVESPGSIAELGSFSVMPKISEKMLVVIEQTYETNDSPSFIFLGPLASLRRRREESVQIFPLTAPDGDGNKVLNEDLLRESWEDIERAIYDSMDRPVHEALFDPADIAHQMVAVAAAIDLSLAMKLNEVERFLASHGIELGTKSVNRILRMLERFGLITSKTYGNLTYYHSRLVSPLVVFRGRNNETFDISRFKVEVVDLYRAHDSHRFKAYRAYLKSAGHGAV